MSSDNDTKSIPTRRRKSNQQLLPAGNNVSNTRYFKIDSKQEPYYPSMPLALTGADNFLLSKLSLKQFMEADAERKTLKLNSIVEDVSDLKRARENHERCDRVLKETKYEALIECTEEIKINKEITKVEAGFHAEITKLKAGFQAEITKLEAGFKAETTKLKVAAAAALLGETTDKEFVEDLVTMTKIDFIKTRLPTKKEAFRVAEKYCVMAYAALDRDATAVKGHVYTKLKEKIKISEETSLPNE
ncbi:hypothetical protein ABK040_012183 [Willaertia magna]